MNFFFFLKDYDEKKPGVSIIAVQFFIFLCGNIEQ